MVPSAMLEASCLVRPSSLSTAGAKATLTVSTMGPHAVARLDNGPNWLVGGAVLVLGCLLCLGVAAKGRRQRVAFALLVSALAAAAFGACGGGASVGGGGPTDPGTPAGTYSVTVSATSGTVSNTANVSVTVK
jgi:hypothetical protein